MKQFNGYEMLKEPSFLNAVDTYGERKKRAQELTYVPYGSRCRKPLSRISPYNFAFLGSWSVTDPKSKRNRNSAESRTKSFPLNRCKCRQLQMTLPPPRNAIVCFLALKNK
jgi:hypothetical protein